MKLNITPEMLLKWAEQEDDHFVTAGNMSLRAVIEETKRVESSKDENPLLPGLFGGGGGCGLPLGRRFLKRNK